jgi:UDP-N-acetylglucosamine acyltransferase
MRDNTSAAIHPTALVDPAARIGENVRVGPYVVIEEDVVIGDGTQIESHSVIKRYTTVGAGNRIAEHVVLGGEPQDYKFEGSRSFVRIGDRNLIREGVTIHRGSKPDVSTSVGDDCFLMAGSHVAHDCMVGNRVIIANGAQLAGAVSVADGAFISGNVLIHQFCRVGRLAFAAGGARISQDCLPFVITEGSPARARALNVVGLRRAGMEAEEIRQLKRALHVLRTTAELETALQELGAMSSSAVGELVQFIRTSSRGFTHPRR